MTLAIQESDRVLALVRRGDSTLWHPERLIKATYAIWWAECEILREAKGIKVHTGWVADSMSSTGRMWTANAIGIGDGAESWPLDRRAPLYCHEYRHPVEVPHHRRSGTLQLKYVFRVRFRWSIEMQGELAVVRWYRQMKLPRSNVLAFAEARARSYAKPFPGYNMGRIANLRRETTSLIMDVFDGKAA